MFDIGFTQLLLIGVVALVVLGPERLPRVARTVGHLLGRAQRYVGDVKSDIQREMELDQLNDLKGQMEDAAKSVKSSVKDATDSLRDPLDDARKALKETTESVESIVKTTQADIDAMSKSAQDELDELSKTAHEGLDKLSEPLEADNAKPVKATTGRLPDSVEPTQALSDTELADQRLAQATSSSDVQLTTTSDNDQKPGTPL